MTRLKKFFSLAMCIAVLLTFTFVSCAQPGVSGSKSKSSKKVATNLASATARNSMPFPRSLNYPGCIKPQEEVNQDIMNKQVKELYVDWVKKYVKPSVLTPNAYYVEMNSNPTGGEGKSSSEAHGYGMLMFAYMAGVDLTGITGAAGILDPKVYFDGMYTMFKAHPSTGNKNLMSWIIGKGELASEDGASATDGDMDIAYALVLAHDQWGSNGTINYIYEAQNIIYNIKKSEMCPTDKRIMLGDWSDWTSSLKEYGTRPSDWMVDHLRVFNRVTGDDFWLGALEEIYSMTDYFQNNITPTTGLISDFVIGNPPRPAPENFLESITDDDYAYNACRFPWRLAVDYAINGEPRAKTALDKIANWLIPAHTDLTGDPAVPTYIPGNIVCGYHLDGTPIVHNQDPPQWHGMSFTAPFTLACMVNPANQKAVDSGWWEMVSTPEGYYEDSVNLLCALLLTGNVWKPAMGTIPEFPVKKPYISEVFNNTDYYPPTQVAPGNLPKEEVPMFVSLGFDDNSLNDGLNWVVDTLAGNKTNPAGKNTATYDGEPVSYSFYQSTFYVNQAGTSWKKLLDTNRHETGNHTDQHAHGEAFSPQQWVDQINTCESKMETLNGAPVKMYGFRTPYLEYNNNLFEGLISDGYWYDCSIEEGFKWGQDGTNFYWPYTLDEGSPGHDVLYEWGTKKFEVTPHNGIWEMPVYCVITPSDEDCAKYGIDPGFRQRLKGLQSWFDLEEGKITGFDYNLLFSFSMNRKEFGGTLMHTLDLRLKGNKAPMLFGTHSEYYCATKAPPKGLDASQGGLEDFINYAISKSDVRVVTNKKILDWIRKPVGLSGGVVVPPTPTIVPETPTPTATPTSTPVNEYVNLALNKKVGVSSTFDAPFGGPNAVDGNMNTAWGSQLGGKSEYIFVNLGSVKTINGIEIDWFDPYFAKAYEIFISKDAKTWTPILNIKNGNGGLDKYGPVEPGVGTQFIGFLFTGANKGAYGIKEIRILGKDDTVILPTPTATPTATPTTEPTVVPPTSTPNNNEYNYTDNVAASQNPPNGLSPAQVPQFVTLGFDDNAYSGQDGSAGTGGMKWAVDFLKTKTNPAGSGNAGTYDGEKVSVSFFYNTIYSSSWQSESNWYVRKAWKEAIDAGFEAGNHTDSHPHGSAYTVAQWQTEMETCNERLTLPYTCDVDPYHSPDPNGGIGIDPKNIYGFRTPFLEYNDNSFAAIKNVGIWYDCSIEEGFQYDQDGTNFVWPYTLDNGSPGHAVQVEWGSKDPISNHPGLWEMPVHVVIVPPDAECAKYGVASGFRQRCKTIASWFDVEGGKITGFDYNLMYSFSMSKEEIAAVLKYTLDLRLSGNKAPMMFGAHTDYYSSKKDAAAYLDRQAAIEDFVNYALTKQDVRIVSIKKILDWMRNPVAL